MKKIEDVCDIILEIKDRVPLFIKHQAVGNGEYMYSYSGDVWKRGIVGTTSFALKQYYALGVKEDNQMVLDAISYIKSFEHAEGTIYDDYIHRKSYLSNTVDAFRGHQKDNHHNERYIRAETRQCISSIQLFGALPAVFPCTVIPEDGKEISFLKEFDWNQPWAAGSHLSHLLFFLKLKKNMGIEGNEEFYEKKARIISWVNTIQNPHSGAWHIGEPSVQQKINGAMKVITGLYAVGETGFDYGKELIDLCLSSINDRQACDNFNTIYVLHKASLNEPKYREEEIQLFVLDKFETYMKYYRPHQSGFSFFEDKANTKYYGARVSKGLNEADMHGTTLFIWGLSIISKLLKIDNKVKIREFLT